MNSETSRRAFLKKGTLLLGASSLPQGCGRLFGVPASEKLTVAFIGTGLQGRNNMEDFCQTGYAQVKTVCDVDDGQIAAGQRMLKNFQSKEAGVEKDYRKVLEDPDIDAVIVSSPDHWHALQTVHAVQAGKDVYVEKPLSHNVEEARKMVEYGKKTGRIVQMGTQQHSGEHYRDAVQLIREGELGDIGTVRAWVTHLRDPLPPKPDSNPPEGVDFDMWLGPAPNRPFNPNKFHYHWRWFWDTGSGELGNWGVHHLDIACWALELRDPQAVYSHGGFAVKDARETPDYQTAVYEYPDLTLTWEHRVWSRKSFGDSRSGILFYGTNASMELTRDGWRVFPNEKDAKGPSAGDSEMRRAHFMDFVDCVKSRETPNSSVETAYYPTLLCHMGNIAYRTKKRLEWDAGAGKFVGDEEANAMLSRPMRSPWKYDLETPRVMQEV